jgi:Response regulator containing CheY-like receiver domain and AraC-type DNA-binding domain
MNRVIIIDDNILIRQGLYDDIPWKENGIEIVDLFSNGSEALEFLKENTVDVIISDIVMPFIGGLDISREIKSLYPAIRIILLTAYSEFEYAKNAIQFGVFDYLVKPVDNEVLLNSVKAAIEEKHNKEKLINQLKLSLPLLNEKTLLRLAKGIYNEKTIHMELEYLQLNFKSKYYYCIVFEIEKNIDLRHKGEEDWLLMILGLKSIIENVFSGEDFTLIENENIQLLLFLGTNVKCENDINSEIYYSLERVLETFLKKFENNLAIGLGFQVDDIMKISNSYNEAYEAIKMKFLMGYNKVFDPKNSKLKNSHRIYNLSTEILSKLIEEMKYGTRSGITYSVCAIKSFLLKNPKGQESVKMLIISMLSQLIQISYELGIEPIEIEEIQSGVYSLFNNNFTQDQLLKEFERLIILLNECINTKRKSRNMQFINQITELIDLNFCDEQIGLDMLAKKVSLSPSYLSAVFKESYKKNLVEYITEKRLNKAKEYLSNTDMKIYEIAEKVGFSNQYYFSLCFKKNIGHTPNDFRKKYQNS